MIYKNKRRIVRNALRNTYFCRLILRLILFYPPYPLRIPHTFYAVHLRSNCGVTFYRSLTPTIPSVAAS